MDNLCFFQTSFFFYQMCIILLKIGKDFNTDNVKRQKDLNTFGSKVLFDLKIMDFENVTLAKVVHINVIEGITYMIYNQL